VQERAGNTLEAIGIGNDFLSKVQLPQQLRERINKWDYMKLKSFCTTKEIGEQWGETSPTQGRGLVPVGGGR
jgi:hypothetical protein